MLTLSQIKPNTALILTPDNDGNGPTLAALNGPDLTPIIARAHAAAVARGVGLLEITDDRDGFVHCRLEGAGSYAAADSVRAVLVRHGFEPFGPIYNVGDVTTWYVKLSEVNDDE